MRRGGVPTAVAASAVATWAAAGGLAHAGGLGLGLAWLNGGGPALAAVALAVTVGVAMITRVARAARTPRVAGAAAPAAWRSSADSTHQHRPRRRSAMTEAVRRRASRIKCTAREILEAARTRPFLAAAALVAQLVAMLCLAVGFAAAVASLGVPVPAAAGAAAYAAGIAAAATIPTPAGIGSTEAALVGTLVVAGATVSEALPSVLLFRAVILLAPVVAAVFVMSAWPTRRPETSAVDPHEGPNRSS